ncbi:MAG: ABC transporter permease [Ruminococcus sp.]|nr:ABC transporter permease [Ruminococcus sp.]
MGNAGTYAFGEAKPVIVIGKTVVVLIFGLAMGFGATYIACARLLRSTAVVLMKEKAPNAVKSKNGGRRAGTLYSRLIVRNMLSDLKRVAVTIVSVAGCCSLLVIGFTLKSSVDRVITKQYGGIVTYDYNITFSSERSASAAADISEILDAHGCEYTELSKEFITCRFSGSNDVAEVYILDPGSVEGYFDLRDAWTNEKISPDSWQNGVLIQKRVAEVCSVKAGDTITLYDSNAKEHKAKVAGVFDNYIGRTMFMSGSYYEELFGTPVRNSQFFVKLNGADAKEVKNEVSEVEGYKSFGRSDSAKDFFKSVSVILNAVIAGMIFMAAMMASVVLLNLTNMYLNQKKRELAIMRINGFTVGQTIGYLARETVITTIIGIILGIAGGSALALQIIHSLENPSLQLLRDPDYIAWTLSAVITELFAFIINYFVMRKVRKLKLTDLAG